MKKKRFDFIGDASVVLEPKLKKACSHQSPGNSGIYNYPKKKKKPADVMKEVALRASKCTNNHLI